MVQLGKQMRVSRACEPIAGWADFLSRVAGIGSMRIGVLALLSLLLGGCAWWSQPPEPAPPPPQPPREWVAEIRAAVASAALTVEVTPLLDPAVADLRHKAQAAELAREFETADTHLLQAIGVREDDPDLWQWRAEIALQQRHWRDAATWAQRSVELGPRIGTLCVRNWLTVAAARTELEDAVSANSARAQVKSCKVPELIRF